MQIDTKPSRISVRQLRKKIRANLRSIPCLLPGILGKGWEFLVMTEDEWILHHHLEEGTDPDEEEEEATAGPTNKIPRMSVIENHGYFVIKESWKIETTILRKREEHSQQLQSFLWKTNIEHDIPLEDQY